MQKAVGILLLLAATVSVSIASPRRSRSAEEPSVPVAKVEEPGTADAAQEAELVKANEEEAQNDQAATPDRVEADELEAADAPYAEETADAGVEPAVSTGTEVEPATKTVVKEKNDLDKDAKLDDEAAEPKTKSVSFGTKLEQFVAVLTEQASQLFGNWGNDEQPNH